MTYKRVIFMDPEIKIENVVASASFDQELDLEEIYERFEDAEYNQEKFPGVVYRLTEPKTAALIFSSGKLVCTGAKNVDDVEVAVDKVINKLREAGIEIKEKPKTVVQNIVASADLDHPLNLNSIAIGFGLESVEYEPEQFPGLVYRLDEPNVVLLLFGSGKIVCTGGKRPEDCEKGVKKVKQELKDLGLL
ncbi:MAG: TATA-box binding protein (TBP), component of TFIID and TFIIIB [Candidatus Methanohalarchaeum thermophilum]|uniref:TATA-box-binding protein n=1 Tax=Methanohalarchaeum thermophilum TaxID=1903181 RepID=A0A1Q6DTB3_METT1|nr:MAG: TATA-box binding protein (TBP), component of TFIID and TFIIIB [Candidatus Methanohalarchaeum thermophilum]